MRDKTLTQQERWKITVNLLLMKNNDDVDDQIDVHCENRNGKLTQKL